jgi:hypothetical protein
MNPAEAVFLYLPISYWAVFLLLLYRHDLSRLSHPFRDNGSTRNWWSVANHLGLLDPEKATRKPGRRDYVPYLGYVIVSVAGSLSWVLRLFPPFWYYLIIVQGVSAIVLTAAALQYLGPPPRRPYVDVLRYPRLGSRIRHLGKIPEVARESEAKKEHQEGAK